jgi:asparagine synthase (glutamine-hydrolysing)
MCGIVGGFGSNLPNIEITTALRTFSHRGPDKEYFFSSNYFVGAVNRLSINDLSDGNQPFFGLKPSTVALYNGEIYNHRDLRQLLKTKSIQVRQQVDGAVIPLLYEIYDLEFLELLDGMFAISIYDAAKKKLILARDTAGEKPLYYSLYKSKVYFSSHLSSFRYLHAETLTLNSQSVWDLVSYLWVPEPATIYEGVHSLLPGETVVFSLDETSSHFYRSFSPDKNLPVSKSEVSEYLADALVRNVKSCLMSDVPIGTFLSGGLDSSLVTTIAAKELPRLDTFSISFNDGMDPYHGKLDESYLAKQYASELGTNHHEIKMTADFALSLLDDFVYKSGQPFAVSSGLGVYAISNLARQMGIKVLLSGDGADELFGGYSWYEYLPKLFELRSHVKVKKDITLTMQDIGRSMAERLESIAKYSRENLLFALHYYGTENEKKQLFNPEFYKDNRVLASTRILNTKLYNRFGPDSVLNSDREIYLPQEMLRKVDLFTMANSVEGRVPFVRSEIYKIALSYRFSELVESGLLKSLLKEAVKKIVPAEILSRPKHGFNFPIDQWLRKEWLDLVNHTFSSSSKIMNMGIINHKQSQIIKDMIWEDRRLNGHTIFSLIILNKFLETK